MLPRGLHFVPFLLNTVGNYSNDIKKKTGCGVRYAVPLQRDNTRVGLEEVCFLHIVCVLNVRICFRDAISHR